MQKITKWFVGLSVCLLVVLCAYGAYQYQSNYTSEYLNVTLDSKILGESRKLFIRLPHEYDPKNSYPLVIKTDGNFNLKRWDEQLNRLTRQYNTPDAIVVSIPNLWWQNTRNRDLVPPYARREVNINPRPDNEAQTPKLGQADKFLEFIKSEVIPYIELNYRVNNRRSLSGFSAGGSFVLYTMVTQPQLFDAYFAFSPAAWYDDNEVVKQTELSLNNAKGKSKYLYLSLGGDEGQIISEAFAQLKQVLITKAPANIHWQYEITPGADHERNPYESLPNALQGYYQYRQRNQL